MQKGIIGINAVEYLLNSEAEENRPALIASAKEFSYGDLRRGAGLVAQILVEAGLKKGDRVLLVDQSSYFWCCVYLGTMMAGCVNVPLPVNTKPEKLEEILKVTSARSVFYGISAPNFFAHVVSSGVPVFQETMKGASLEKNMISQKDLCNGTGTKNMCPVNHKVDLATLMFTSGSTGEPRGVMVTHENIIANTKSIIDSMSLTQFDRIMAILPFSYCFGTSLLHTHLATGGSIVIENSFLYPEVILNRMEETKCTGLAGVPSTFHLLLRRSTFRDREFANLRYIQQAGGKLPNIFIRELRSVFPEKDLFIMYGQTEATARLSCLPPERLDSKLGSIGKGIPGVNLEVLDKTGRQVAPGKIGEIVASGDNVSTGYWEAPEETATYFKNGKLFTGDLATVDEDGFIYIVDREKDFIKCAGYRVGSKEIESVIFKLDGVIEAMAVGEEDEYLGESICVFVSHLRGEGARAELEDHCKSNFKWPFVPKKIIILESIPKNSSGKPDKLKLKAILATFVKSEYS